MAANNFSTTKNLSEAPEAINTDVYNAIKSYIQASLASNSIPSLEEYLTDNVDHISDHTDLRMDIRRVWTKRYATVAQTLGVMVTHDEEIDWDQIKCLIKESKTVSKPTSSPTARLMTEAALKDVKQKYSEVLESGQVWKLESGRIVEKVMMDVADAFEYEHPVHSLIMNPDDLLFEDKFTKAELDEIKNTKSVEFDQELPSEMKEYLYSFSDKKTLDQLNDAVVQQTFHPTRESDLHWVRKSFENAVDLYNYDILKDHFAEDDAEHNAWSFIATCFHPTRIRATSSSQNQMLSGHEPEMKYTYLGYKLGLNIVGLDDVCACGAKELLECEMEASKMLKHFFTTIVNDNQSTIREAKTAAFILSGLHMTILIMDSPKGSACRITQSERVLFPCDADICAANLIPILELTYRVRLYLLDTVKAISSTNQIVSVGKMGKKRALIPQCIISPYASSSTAISSTDTKSSSNKRQKH
ncbi:hypothetical protein BJV82DRAFT_657405 [Fennellomyces sp. T-0311]|nr:hypothetical protein BJV82DRAFT_657405 [Fennellomyces sp. T-0311]